MILYDIIVSDWYLEQILEKKIIQKSIRETYT